MQGRIERFSLPDGEEAVIHELRAPLGAGADALIAFWAGRGLDLVPPRVARDIETRLTAREDIGDRWYVATTIEGIVCALELSRSNRIPHLGSIHNLYTAPHRREQGLARHVVEVALDRFSSDGGHGILAQTTVDSPAHQLLRSFDFQDYLVMPGTSGRVTSRLVFGDADAFDSRYFGAMSAAPARRPLRRSDKAALLHLLSAPVPYLIRYHGLHAYGAYGMEEAVLLLLDTLERGKGTSIIGVAAEGTPAALGTVLPADLPAASQPYREHVRTLDLFAAPDHENALAPVLEALLVRADVLPGVRRLNSVVDAANFAVRTTLEEAGFEQAGILHEFAALAGTRADAVLYELTREEPAPPIAPAE